MASHLTLVPADRLAASYSEFTQTLTLFASGKVLDFVVGIDFRRLPWIGGLRFELVGWRRPGRIVRPYTARKPFRIPYIRRVAPSGKVIIVTANHPRGVLVPIKFILRPGPVGAAAAGAGDDETKAILGDDSASTEKLEAAASDGDDGAVADAAAAGAGAGAGAAGTVVPVKHHQTVRITTHVGLAFTIREPLVGSVTHETNVELQFSRHNFALAVANVRSGELVWNLRAIVTGTSHAYLVHTYGRGLPVVHKSYVINVLPSPKVLRALTAGALAVGGDSAAANVADDDDDDNDDDDDADADAEDAEATVTFDDDGEEADADAADGDADEDDEKAVAAQVAAANGLGGAGLRRVHLDYLPALRLAVRIVQTQLRAPDARLLIATAAQSLRLPPTTDVRRLQLLDAVIGFTDPRTKRGATATLRSRSWGAWGAPSVKLHPLLGARAVDLAHKPLLSIVAAQAAGVRAGPLRGRRINSVALNWPLTAAGKGGKDGKEGKDGGDGDEAAALTIVPADEPKYTFYLERKATGPNIVLVGAWSGRVRASQAATSVLQLSDEGEGEGQKK